MDGKSTNFNQTRESHSDSSLHEDLGFSLQMFFGIKLEWKIKQS